MTAMTNGGDTVTTKQKQLRLIGYYRVSRVGDREGDSFQAPKRYEKTIRDYCAGQSDLRLLSVVGELDVSGSKLDRAKLQREVIDPILDGKADGLVVPNLSRLSRLKPTERAALVELIEGAGGVIRSATENLDPTTPAGRAFREILFTFARMEWEDKAANFAASKQSAIERGVHIAGKVPVGYLRGADSVLVIDQAKAPAIRAAFDLRASGASLAAVCDQLEELLPGGPSGDGYWRKGTTKRILASRTYLGEARQGEFVNEHAHEAIVDRRTFDAVQAMFRRVEPDKRPSAKSLLAGVAYCACCGYALQNTGTHQVRAGRPYSYRIYRCRADGGSAKCTAPVTAMQDPLEQLIEEAVLDRCRAAGGIEQTADDAEAESLLDQLAVARGKRAPFEDPDYVAALGTQAALRALSQVNAEIEQLEGEYAAVTAETPALSGSKLIEVAEKWPILDVAEKREVISDMIDTVLVSRAPRGTLLKDRVEIVWVGSRSPVERPSRGRPVEKARIAAA